MDGRIDERMDRQVQNNMPLQRFQSLGIKSITVRSFKPGQRDHK